jgi:hypothetical protein
VSIRHVVVRWRKGVTLLAYLYGYAIAVDNFSPEVSLMNVNFNLKISNLGR